jgi:small subunit ribosomal protein S15e
MAYQSDAENRVSSVFVQNSIRRRLGRHRARGYNTLMKKLRKAKKEAPMHEKPDVVKTHLRNMVIMPEMIGSVVGVYNGKSFVSVEIKVLFPASALSCPGGSCSHMLSQLLFRGR